DPRSYMATMDEYIDQLLSETEAPKVLQRVVQNILDEPISEAVKWQLLKPLLLVAARLPPPPRGKREIRERNRKAVLEEFDPSPVQKRLKTVQDYQERVDTAFYLRYLYTYEIRDVEDGTVIQFHKNHGGSPWINRLAEAETWLSNEEKKRRDPDNINRPNTKWVFVRFISTVVKVVLDRQPLMGTGLMPDWLRNLAHSRALMALDNYGDNLCLWRCIAVHRGARRDRNTEAARKLAKSFYELATAPRDVPKTSLDALAEVKDHLGHGCPIAGRLGIRVYEPEHLPVALEGEQIIWHLRQNTPEVTNNVMTIGIYGGHAFLIKDIGKLAQTYACGHCGARFTQACHLQRHTTRCARGETKIECPNEKVQCPQTAYEKALYPNHTNSSVSIRWLETQASEKGVHIHHAACGHGGQRWLEGAPVDGFILREKTREQLYQATRARTQKLQDAGYTVHEVSVGDTLDPNPTHICCREPKQLLLQFMEELDRRGAQIRRAVRADYLPDDLGTLPKKQRTKIEEWCDQVPVWGSTAGVMTSTSSKSTSPNS
ncbi:hypothetical protein QZH41_007688, partial [Actinostola sp. cb2023]